MNKRLAVVAVSIAVATVTGAGIAKAAQNNQPPLKAAAVVHTPSQDAPNTPDDTTQPVAKITVSPTQSDSGATASTNQPETAQSTAPQEVAPILVTKAVYSMDTSGGSYCELTYTDGSTILKQAVGSPTQNLNGSFSYDPHCQDYLGQAK